MKLFLLTLILSGSTRAQATECGHWLAGKLFQHASVREALRSHTLVSSIAAKHPLEASMGRVMRWNVVTNVPVKAPGWAREGFRHFIQETGQRVEVIPARDPEEGTRAVRTIVINPLIESELIWVIVDLTEAPDGSWLSHDYEPMWDELSRRRDLFLAEDEDEPQALILPIVLIPDDLQALPRREIDRFQIQRPNVPQIFGFQSFQKLLK